MVQDTAYWPGHSLGILSCESCLGRPVSFVYCSYCTTQKQFWATRGTIIDDPWQREYILVLGANPANHQTETKLCLEEKIEELLSAISDIREELFKMRACYRGLWDYTHSEGKEVKRVGESIKSLHKATDNNTDNYSNLHVRPTDTTLLVYIIYL